MFTMTMGSFSQFLIIIALYSHITRTVHSPYNTFITVRDILVNIIKKLLYCYSITLKSLPTYESYKNTLY